MCFREMSPPPFRLGKCVYFAAVSAERPISITQMKKKKKKTEGLMEVFFDHHLYFILKELRAKQSRTMCSEKPVIK